MKKALLFIVSLVFTFSLAVFAVGCGDKGGGGNGGNGGSGDGGAQTPPLNEVTVTFSEPTVSLDGQNYTLVGYSEEIFANAEIKILSGEKEYEFTRNSTNGKIVASLPDGEYTLFVSYDGQKTVDFTVDGKENLAVELPTDNKIIVLKNGAQTLEVLTVNEGETISPTVTPTKVNSRVYAYEFSGWKKGNASFPLTEKVTESAVLTAEFARTVREYETKIKVVSEQETLFGKSYDSFDFDEEEVTVAVSDGDGNPVEFTYDEGEITTTLKADEEYTVTASYISNTLASAHLGTLEITAPNGDEEVIELSHNYKVGGKVWGTSAVDQVERAYSSYTGNRTIHADDSVTLSGITFLYMNAPYTDKYYIETLIDMPVASAGQMVGIMASSERKNLSGSADAGGSDDKGGKTLVFALSGGSGNTLFYRNATFFGNTGIVQIGSQNEGSACAKAQTGKATKFAVVRNANYYYIFVNDVHVYTISNGGYDKGAVGFHYVSNKSTSCRYDDIKLTLSSSVVDEVIATKVAKNDTLTNEFSVGGAGVTYTSADGKEGGILGGQGMKLSTTTDTTYFVETYFEPHEAWRGIIVNTLGATANDLNNATNKGWFGFGILNSTLYMHQYQSAWTQGTALTTYLESGVTIPNATSTGYKLGVARRNDEYLVFVNDKLAYKGVHEHFSYADGTTAVASNNLSAYGIYCGANGVKTARYNSFNAIVGEEAFKQKMMAKLDFSIVGEGGAYKAYQTISVADTASAINRIDKVVEITDSGYVYAGISVDFALSATSSVDYSMLPEANETYEFEYDFTNTANCGKIALSLENYSATVNETKYYFVNDTIVSADAEITLVSKTSNIEYLYDFASLATADIMADDYHLIVKYKDIENEYDITVAKGETLEFTAGVASAHLGGTVTVNGITYESFRDTTPTALYGSGWSIPSGLRDEVVVTSHTFVMQNEVVDDTYYIEARVDSTSAFTRGTTFSGLMLSHATDFDLDDSPSDYKFVASIYNGHLMVALAKAWNPADTRALARLSDYGVTPLNEKAVKLGVIRENTVYHFFVEDTYIISYTIPEIDGDSGFGLARLDGSTAGIMIKDFRYTLNADFITALKGKVTTEKEIDLFFIAGQSNASGYSSVNTASAKYSAENHTFGFDSNILYAGDAESSTWSSGVVSGTNHNLCGWQMVRIGQGKSSSHIGAEAGLAKKLAPYYATQNKDAGIIKFAHGGTALRDIVTGENSCSGNWTPPSYFDTHSKADETLSGGLYNKFVAEVEKRVNELKKMGYTKFNFKGLFWMQGCSDKSVPDTYKSIFKLFASDIRKDLGEIASTANGKTVDLSGMEIYIGEISRTQGSAVTATVTTNTNFIAMQNALENEINDITVINSSELKINDTKDNGATSFVVGTDQSHWSFDDMMTIGERLGTAILKNN